MSAYKALIVAASILINGNVVAAIYKTVDADGNVVYTDEPVGDAKPVDLPPLSTIPPPASLQQNRASEEEVDDSGDAYKQLTIVSPEPEATVRDNTGNVPVSVSLAPELNKAAGHRIQYYLDGQTEGEPTASLKTVFSNIDRGAHTVEAAVVDNYGNELKRSGSVRFYLHRQSINFPRGPGAPTPR